MKKLLTATLALVALAVFTGPGNGAAGKIPCWSGVSGDGVHGPYVIQGTGGVGQTAMGTDALRLVRG